MKLNLIILFILSILISCSKDNTNNISPSTSDSPDIEKVQELVAADIFIENSSSNVYEQDIQSGTKRFTFNVKNVSSLQGKIKIALSYDAAVSYNSQESSCVINSYKILNPNESCQVSISVDTNLIEKGIYAYSFYIQDKNNGNILTHQFIVSFKDSQNISPPSNDPISACKVNTHMEARKCLSNLKDCEVLPSNSQAGTQLWNGTSYNQCLVSSCTANYQVSSDSLTCVSSIRNCTITDLSDKGYNITHVLAPQGTTNGSDLSACLINSCFSGYHPSSNNTSCDVDIPACSISPKIKAVQFSVSPAQNSLNFEGVKEIAEQSDGKIIVPVQYGSEYRLVRYLSNGIQDSAFNVAELNFSSSINNIEIQSDGKILVVGDFTKFGTTITNRIARLNTDGTLDSSFITGSGLNGRADLVRAKGSSIYITGSFTSYNGVSAISMVKINSAGTRDTNFNVGTGISGYTAYDMLIDANDKILVVGQISNYNGTTINNIVRLMPLTGAIDTSFITTATPPAQSPTTGTNGAIYRVKIYNSLIYIGGNFTTYRGYPRKQFVSLDNNGNDTYSITTGFRINSSTNLGPRYFDIDSSGNIYAIGNYNTFVTSASQGFTKFTVSAPSSIINTTFATILAGSGITNYSGDIKVKVLSDGNLMVYGYNLPSEGFKTYKNQLVNSFFKVNSSTAALIPTYFKNTGFNGEVKQVLKAGSKHYVLGRFTTYNNLPYPGIIRFNSDNTIDTSFVNHFSGRTYFRAGLVQSNGKILLAPMWGYDPQYNGSTFNNNIRLNEDGSMDESFIDPVYGQTIINYIQLADGKIVIAGSFQDQYVDGIGSYGSGLLKLNEADGSIDYSFNIGIGLYIDYYDNEGGYYNYSSSSPQSMEYNPIHNTIVLGGYFNMYNSQSVSTLIEINLDGSIYRQYNNYGNLQNSPTSPYPTKIKVSNDGKIYTVDQSGMINRFSEAGILESYYPSIGSSNSLLPLPNGELLVGSSYNSLKKILNDGTVSLSFNQGGSIIGSVNSIVEISPGSYYLSGLFSNINSNYNIFNHTIIYDNICVPDGVIAY